MDIIGKMSRENLHVVVDDSRLITTAVVTRRGSRYRTTASVMPYCCVTVALG